MTNKHILNIPRLSFSMNMFQPMKGWLFQSCPFIKGCLLAKLCDIGRGKNGHWTDKPTTWKEICLCCLSHF